jgi:ribosome-binding protein aMBF1 (putative translation factor)
VRSDRRQLAASPQPLPRTSLEPVCLALPVVIRYRREALGWSPGRLGEKTNLSGQAIRYLEAGQRVPGFDTGARLSRAFGITLTRLIAEAECRRRAEGCNNCCVDCRRLVVL